MDWLDETIAPKPVLLTLRRLLDRHFPDDGRTSGRCVFQDDDATYRVFHAVSAIDCKKLLIAWQRQNWVIALAQPSSEAGRMAMGAPAPISLRVAQEVLAFAMMNNGEKPHDSYKEAMAASRKSAGASFFDSAAATVFWQDGLEQRHVSAGDLLPPNQLAALMAVAFSHSRS
jgi:hypothetical protein